MSAVFSYNQEAAAQSGGSDYVELGGGYICTIKQAEYITAKSGAQAIEFTLETSEGLKCGHVKVYYKKKDGGENTYGTAIINAIMGLLKLHNLSSKSVGAQYFCPELSGKTVGLFLQKIFYVRQDTSVGFKFEIAVPYSAVNRKTMREVIENKPAAEIDKRTLNYKDKHETNNYSPAVAGQQPDASKGHAEQNIPGWDDDEF